MIWHLVEIWLLVLAAFLAGSLIGALGYAGLSRSPMARLQGALADRVGDMIDDVKTRFGADPVWRPKVRRNRIRPSLQARRAAASPADEAATRFRERPVDVRPPAWPAERLARPKIASIAQEESAEGEVNGAGPPSPEDERSPAAFVEGYADEAGSGEEVPFESLPDRPAIVPMRPAGLAAPRNGVPDNLQRIRGIGRRNEELLNSLGIFHFGQIASWTPAEARWIGAYLSFPERIERDDWIGQATILASGGNTGYVKAERKKARDEEAS